jgi:TonB family protein
MSARVSSTYQEDSFKSSFWLSLICHFILLFGATLKVLFFPSDIIEIPDSIRVDLVALPDKPSDVMPPMAESKKETSPIKPLEPVKEKPKVDTKKTQKKAIEKLKALSAIEKMKSEINNTKKSNDNTIPPPKVVKGNVISSGSDFQGLSRLRVNDFVSQLKSRVRENWLLPQWLSESNLKASVYVQIDSDGRLVKNNINVSSGNSVFDSSCLAAVENSAPFPPAPDEVSDNIILIRFPFD